MSYVSIHAPTRGATSLFVIFAIHIGVSIHAPTRGATCRSIYGGNRFPVSIHAPTRGGAVSPWIIIVLVAGFNPRSHEGSDENAADIHG